MNQKIYLVKKDPAQTGGNIEWIQMSGAEFYAFTKSPAAKGRYFIRLTDDISYECPEIFIEASYADYRKWKSEYNAHQYLREQEEGYETVSADMPITSDSDSVLLDTIASDELLEEQYLEKTENERLMSVIQSLPKSEQYIIKNLYLGDIPKKQRALAIELRIKEDVLAKRKKKILRKIFDLLGKF